MCKQNHMGNKKKLRMTSIINHNNHRKRICSKTGKNKYKNLNKLSRVLEYPKKVQFLKINLTNEETL